MTGRHATAAPPYRVGAPCRTRGAHGGGRIGGGCRAGAAGTAHGRLSAARRRIRPTGPWVRPQLFAMAPTQPGDRAHPMPPTCQVVHRRVGAVRIERPADAVERRRAARPAQVAYGPRGSGWPRVAAAGPASAARRIAGRAARRRADRPEGTGVQGALPVAVRRRPATGHRPCPEAEHGHIGGVARPARGGPS